MEEDTMGSGMMWISALVALASSPRPHDQIRDNPPANLLKSLARPGLANYMGKVFTGKYFSDLFWDEVYD